MCGCVWVCVCTYNSLGEIKRPFFNLRIKRQTKRISGTHAVSYPMGIESFSGVKRPESKANHPPQSNSQVKNMWMDATHRPQWGGA